MSANSRHIFRGQMPVYGGGHTPQHMLARDRHLTHRSSHDHLTSRSAERFRDPRDNDTLEQRLNNSLANNHGLLSAKDIADLTCGYCGHVFKQTEDFKRHVRIHTGERPFACQFCPHRAAQRGNLRRHIIKKHSEILRGLGSLNSAH